MNCFLYPEIKIHVKSVINASVVDSYIKICLYVSTSFIVVEASDAKNFCILYNV